MEAALRVSTTLVDLDPKQPAMSDIYHPPPQAPAGVALYGLVASGGRRNA